MIPAVALFPGPKGVVILARACRRCPGPAGIPGERQIFDLRRERPMDESTATPETDVDRALRDRLSRKRAVRTSVWEDAELNLAVNDLQDLARSRFATNPDEARR
jgi:hypothetical protein